MIKVFNYLIATSLVFNPFASLPNKETKEVKIEQENLISIPVLDDLSNKVIKKAEVTTPNSRTRRRVSRARGGNVFQRGIASWYGKEYHGRTAANGSRYNMYSDTCAHRSARFGTRFLVKNTRNGRTTICRVTDRGPFIRGRIIDLSFKGARDIGIVNAGIAPVTLTKLD